MGVTSTLRARPTRWMRHRRPPRIGYVGRRIPTRGWGRNGRFQVSQKPSELLRMPRSEFPAIAHSQGVPSSGRGFHLGSPSLPLQQFHEGFDDRARAIDTSSSAAHGADGESRGEKVRCCAVAHSCGGKGCGRLSCCMTKRIRRTSPF